MKPQDDKPASGPEKRSKPSRTEEARRIVDPILKASAPVLEYDKGAWGSGETEQSIFPHGRSDSPTAADQDDFRFAAEFA